MLFIDKDNSYQNKPISFNYKSEDKKRIKQRFVNKHDLNNIGNNFIYSAIISININEFK